MYAAASLIILGSAPLLYIGDSTPQPTYPMLMSNTKVVLQSKLNHQSFCLTSESFSGSSTSQLSFIPSETARLNAQSPRDMAAQKFQIRCRRLC